jgi:hypothetical protein
MRLPIRGGNWNNVSKAGVFYLNLNNERSNSNNNIGFRSALFIFFGQKFMTYVVMIQYRLHK